MMYIEHEPTLDYTVPSTPLIHRSAREYAGALRAL